MTLGPGTVNGVDSLLLLEADGTDDNIGGVTVKRPDNTWGGSVAYGMGQPFMVLNESDSDVDVGAAVVKAITSVQATTPVRLTVTSHGAITGDVLRVTGTGKAALDMKWWQITVIDANTVSLDGSTNQGTASVGLLAGDRSPVVFRVAADGGIGTTSAIHVASGLRGISAPSGYAVTPAGGQGFGSATIQPYQDLPGVIIYTPDVNAWPATPISSLLQVYDVRSSPGRTLFSVGPDGTITHRRQSGKAGSSDAFRVRNDGDSANLFAVSEDGHVGLGFPSSTGWLLIGVADTDAVGGIALLQHSSGQTGDFLMLLDSSGTQPLAGYNKNAYAYTKKNAAPADAELATNMLMHWWDSTNKKVMFKGKDSTGTVRSGSLTLT